MMFWNPAVGHGPSPRPDAGGRHMYWIQRRDRPIAYHWLEDPLERRLLELALEHGREALDGDLSPEELERAIEMGALLDADSLPPEPPQLRVELRSADAGRAAVLEKNLDLIWQTEEVPPGLGVTFEPHPKSHGGAFSPARPIVWVKQTSGIYSPVWPGEHEPLLRSFASVELDSLAPGLVSSLVSHGILRAPDEAERWRERVRGWRDDYARDRVVVIEGVHPEPLLSAFRGYARSLKAAGLYRIDVRTVKDHREGMYQEVVSRLIHHQVAKVIGEVLDRAIKASYCWFRRYLPGAILERHSDRPQCRWNVSMCIDSEPENAAREWPIHLDVDGTTRTIPLSPGQMVLYAGTELPHWRDELPAGRYVTNFFFHFVEESFEGSLD